MIKQSKKDLIISLQDKRSELRSLRFNLIAGRLKSVTKIKKTRKEIAQILTIINDHSSKEK